MIKSFLHYFTQLKTCLENLNVEPPSLNSKKLFHLRFEPNTEIPDCFSKFLFCCSCCILNNKSCE